MTVTTPVRPAIDTVAQRSEHVRTWKRYQNWIDYHDDVTQENLTEQFVRDGRLPPEWINRSLDNWYDENALSEWISNGPREGVYGPRPDGTYELAYWKGILYRRGDYVAVTDHGGRVVGRITGFKQGVASPEVEVTCVDETVSIYRLTLDLSGAVSESPTPAATTTQSSSGSVETDSSREGGKTRSSQGTPVAPIRDEQQNTDNVLSVQLQITTEQVLVFGGLGSLILGFLLLIVASVTDTGSSLATVGGLGLIGFSFLLPYLVDKYSDPSRQRA